MRRVFLSFLGTNDYIPCNYLYGSFPRITNVRFVQEALIQWLCGDWDAGDKILIFCTEESVIKNWLENGHTREDGAICEGLLSRLSRLGLAVKCESIKIPSGKNEQEIWKIFDTFVAHIKAGDCLHLDITHAFRSLPMLAVVLLNYVKILQGEIKIESLCYGAMEALGELKEVRGLPVEQRDVPVFDLLPFDRLNDWSIAIDRFIVTGDARQLVELTKQNITPILTDTKGKDRDAAALRYFSNQLEAFATARNTCRGQNLHSTSKSLCDSLAKVKKQNLITPLKPLLKKIEKEVASNRNDEIAEGIAAAEWCLKRNLYQQGYTILQEIMLSFLQEKAFDVISSDKDERTLINQSISIVLNNIPANEWKKEARESPEKVQIVSRLLTGDILIFMRDLSNFRNDINHCGMKPEPMKHTTIRDGLKDFIDKAQLIVSGN